MEQSSDKVLENAQANGGESHGNGHRETHTLLMVFVTQYRNSLTKNIEAPGNIHVHVHVQIHVYIHIHV